MARRPRLRASTNEVTPPATQISDVTEFAPRRQHVGNPFCGEGFQSAGNVVRGRPVNVKFLHMVKHTEKCRLLSS